MPHPGWSVFRFEGIGTSWEIATPDHLPEQLRDELLETVAVYDRTYSRFRADSLVSQLAQAPGTIALPGMPPGFVTCTRSSIVSAAVP